MTDMAAAAPGTAGHVARLEQDRQSLERELDEIEMLLSQARVEADRHEARRRAAEERFDEMMRPYSIQSGLREAHQQLMVQAQRAALMAAQIEVLEGKQKVLRRYAEGMRRQIEVLASAGAGESAGDGGERAPSREVLAAQEDLRRAIARQMHDGPAQSIANIALQAQVAQRLLARDAQAANRELDALRQLVQHALEATKAFIFEVRPMVLDDLGLLPTLRRSARERAQRSGVPVQLESHGSDRRLDREIESHLFRIVDDAVAGFVARAPEQVTIRLDWTPERLVLIVRTFPPAVPAAADPPPAEARPSRGGRDAVPEALAGMIAQQAAETAERAAGRYRAYGLSDGLWRELEARAATVGIRLGRDEDALRLEALVDTPSA
jgi:two-component system, NarL family, sensor histidine kinase DegS